MPNIVYNDMILPYTMFERMAIKFDQSSAGTKIVIESVSDTKYVYVNLNEAFNPEILKHIYSQDYTNLQDDTNLIGTMNAF